MEIKLVLAVLLQRFRFELAGNTLMNCAKGNTMQQENRNRQAIGRVKAGGMIVAAYVLGTSGGLFLYPYLSSQALIGFGLLIVGNLILLVFATRPNRAA